MAISVLVIDKTPDAATALLETVGKQRFKIAFVNKTDQALSNLEQHKYDLVIMGDRLLVGDTFEVGLELRTLRTNKAVPVICIGENPSRTKKLEGVLAPYVISVRLADEASVRFGVARIKESFGL